MGNSAAPRVFAPADSSSGTTRTSACSMKEPPLRRIEELADLEHDVAKKFLCEVVALARSARLMSDDHFTVDGTLIEAWASIESFRPKDEGPKDRPPPANPG